MDKKRFATGVVCLIILAGCFVKVPLEQADQRNGIWLWTEDDQINTMPNETLNFTVWTWNTGNVKDRVRFSILDAELVNTDGWVITFDGEGWDPEKTSGKTAEMKPTHNRTVTVFVKVPEEAKFGDSREVWFGGKSDLNGRREMQLMVRIVVGPAMLKFPSPALLLVPGETGTVQVLAKSLEPRNMTANLTIGVPTGWWVVSSQWAFEFRNNDAQMEQWVTIWLTLPADISTDINYNVTVMLEVDDNTSLRDMHVLPVVLPGPHSIRLGIDPMIIEGVAGSTAPVTVTVKGLSSNTTTVDIGISTSAGVSVSQNATSVDIGPYGSATLVLNVTLTTSPDGKNWLEVSAIPRQAQEREQKLIVDVRVR